MANNTAALTFPVLNTKEIIHCMNELLIPIENEDIMKPQQQRTTHIYTQVLILLIGYSPSTVTPFTLLEILEHPDLHSDAIHLLLLFKQLYKALREIGVEDFCLHDVIKPESARLKMILSGVINFIKFREDHLGIYEECTKKTDEAHELKTALEHKNAILSEKVNSIRLTRAEQEPAVEVFRLENSKLASELRELKRLQQSIQAEIDASKKEKSELDDKLTNINCSVANAKQECELLQSRIVRNPEELKAAIKNMNDNVNLNKQHILDLEKKVRGYLVKVEVMNSVENEIQSAIKIMHECQAERKKHETEEGVLSKCRETLDSKQSEIRELGIKEQQANRQLKVCQDKLNRLLLHQTTKQKNIDEKLEGFRKEYAFLSLERDEIQAKLDENLKIMNEMEEKMSEVKKTMEMEEEKIQNDIRVLTEHLEGYMCALAPHFRVKGGADVTV